MQLTGPDGLAARLGWAIRDGDAETAADLRERIEAAAGLGNPPDPDPWESLAERLEAAESEDAAVEEARAALRPKLLQSPPWAEPEPEPVLWRDERGGGSLLGSGEVGILAGSGGSGKSTVALALAHAARERGPGTACGLAVRRGHIVIASYEDTGPRLAARMKWSGHAGEWGHVRIAPGVAPLWMADPEDRRAATRGPDWRRFWDEVAEFGPSLAIVDPVSVALAGISGSDGPGVRAFLLDVAGEAERCGCSVLLVAHDTKSARTLTRAGEDPGAGAVAGSSQWFDGSRAVLHLARVPGGDSFILEAVKSNYGPSGWGVELAPKTHPSGSGWGGLEFARQLSREEVRVLRKPPKTKAESAKAETNGELIPSIRGRQKW